MCDKTRLDFLMPETRCGYHVDEKMKAVWQVELNILEAIMAICQKHDIKYFLIEGSMLGAVRHKGFVPWDDDLDVGMMREDYDRFVEVAQSELPAHMFLQTSLTDKGYFFSFAKVKDSNTTALDKVFADIGAPINYGIFVDVFPLDGLPSGSEEEVCKYYRKIHLAQNFLRRSFYGGGSTKLRSMMADVFSRLFGWNRLSRIRDALLRRQSSSDSEFCISGIGVLSSKMIWRTEWFKTIKWVPFEYLTVPIPLMSETILTHRYGDWHEFVHNGALHTGNITFDPYHPFSQFSHE